MSGAICALAGGGGQVPIGGSATLTIGSGGYDFNDGTYRYVDTTYGYNSGLFGYGSLSNTAFIAGTNIAITQLRYDLFRYYTYPGNVLVGTIQQVLLIVDEPLPNSGWTSITIGAVTYTRASANYSSDASQTTWSWNVSSNTVGTSGTRSVSWS